MEDEKLRMNASHKKYFLFVMVDMNAKVVCGR